MAVPINFLEKMNNKQFQLVSFCKGDNGKDIICRQSCLQEHSFKSFNIISSTHTLGVLNSGKEVLINNKETFKRILIQRIPVFEK